MSRTLQEEILAGLPLSERELEALHSAALGESWGEAGMRLHFSRETIRSNRRSAIAKLAARNITHAVVIAVGMGYVNIEEILEEHEART